MRIIIEGSFCEQPPLDLIKILEEAGCYIIDDDFVLGSTIVAALFDQPIRLLLGRIISDDISRAWTRYLKLAIYVVGISGGVRVWSLERYISKRSPTDEILQLTRDRWLIEIYQTIMGTLQSVVWLLLVFFVFALIAYVIVRGLELRGMKVND